MKLFTATNPDRLSIFHEIRRQWRKQLAQGMFYAEGEQVIARLLQSPLKVLSMLITPEYLEQWREFISARDPDTEIWIAEKKWMEKHTGQKLNQPCLAIGQVPASPLLKDLIRSGPCCFVALAGIDHAVNVGSILRNCAAFGVTALLMDKSSVEPYCWRAIRTSLGGVFHVNVYACDSLIDLLRVLQTYQIDLIAADPHGTVPIGQINFSRNWCLIFGNEHSGLSPEILDLVTERAAIPGTGNVDSLNVAAASAVFLYQASVVATKIFPGNRSSARQQ